MLIIDKPMPKNCDECIFATDCSFCEGYDDHCVLNDGNAEIGFKNGKEYQYWDFSCEIIPKERPSWCPIKGEISEIELMHLEEERAFAARNIAAERKDDERTDKA